jgi:hypothetical protein
MSRTPNPRRFLWLLGLSAIITSIAAPAGAADPGYDTLAEELARLRGEIEALDARLEDQQDTRRSQLRALAAQKSALELELQREELRHQQLSERLARGQEKSQGGKAKEEALAKAVAKSARQLLPTLDGVLPFQLDERRAELVAIAEGCEAGTLLASAGLDRLWVWVDEELKLARENAVHKQVIKLGDEEVLAEVARLGQVALYFRTPDHRYGLWTQVDGQGRWQTTQNVEVDQKIEALFVALQAGPAKGFFTLPGQAIAAQGGR